MSPSPKPGPGKWRLNWRQVGILYGRELRASLRDKSIVLNSILIPVLLYPFLLWVAFSALMLIRGESESTVVRVRVVGWPEDHPRLRRMLEHDEKLRLTSVSGEAERAVKSSTAKPIADSGLKFDARHQDALLVFHRVQTNFPGVFHAAITYDKSNERSAAAYYHLVDVLEEYREAWIKREARKRGIDGAAWQGFSITNQNVASKKDVGAFVLGLMLPVIFAVMVATGCFYPAVDTLAGERERGTWETLMSTAAQRSAILVAKYLHVVTFGGLAGVLNLAAVTVTLKPIMETLGGGAGRAFEVHIPWMATPLLVVAAVLLAGFVAAGMMVFAAFARTFKEGQSMITPFYLVLMVPVVFLQVPGLQLAPASACVPVVNVVLLLRTVLSGAFPWISIGVTVLSSLVVIAFTLAVAAWILRFEEIATGAFQGNIARFLRLKMARNRRSHVR